MQIADFKKEHPNLAERIETERFLRDGQFVYHKTGLYVLRKEPADFNQPFWEHFEAHRQVKTRKPDMAHFFNKQRNAKQKRLLEVSEK